MGLDGVELVMAVEEAFGVTITDGEAVKTVTPGMVTDLIFTKLKLIDEKTCQSQRAFYLLRRALMTTFHKRRNELKPDTPLKDIFPGWDCTSRWFELQKAVDARSWPKPERPQWMGYAIFALAMATLVATPYFLIRKSVMNNIPNVVTMAIAASIAIAILITIATRPFRCSIPHRFKIIRDLIPFVITSNAINWTRDLVAKVVKDTVIEQLGIDESKYSETALFVDDLGMG